MEVTDPPDLGLFEVNEAAEVVLGAAGDNANLTFEGRIEETLSDQLHVTVTIA
jgi:cell division protein FtsZ